MAQLNGLQAMNDVAKGRELKGNMQWFVMRTGSHTNEGAEIQLFISSTFMHSLVSVTL